MVKRRHKRKFHKNKQFKPKKPITWKKFFYWLGAYFIFISLLTLLFEKTQIYQNKIGFYIIMGYLLVLLSRVFYSATKGKSFRLKGIIVWGLIYTITFGVLSHFLSLLPQVQLNPSLDKYITILIFSIIFTLAIIFLRRMKIGRGRGKFKTPSQIFTGIILLAFGLMFFRFSSIIFLQWFNWPEGMAWSWLIGTGFLVGGFLTLLAWWRNNVLQHRIGIKRGKWK